MRRGTERGFSNYMWSHVGVAALLLIALAAPGCAAESEAGEAAEGSAITEAMQDGEPKDFPEVVQVLVNNTAEDFCTGVLVSPTRVLTAAHCTIASTYTVVAPHAEGAPRRTGKKVGQVHVSSNFDAEVAKEDAAVLDLDAPITVPSYPEMRDVGELGTRTLLGVAVGRKAVERDAPLAKSKRITARSGTPDGYTTGLTSERYSTGGDSGGPLFLVDSAGRSLVRDGTSGKTRHVVIGIERAFEEKTERFTRITPKVLELLAIPPR